MAIRVPDHPVPPGPLAARFLSYELGPLRAGTWSHLLVALENAGSATWHVEGPSRVRLSYHILDAHGNTLLKEGLRAVPPGPVAPRQRIELKLTFGVPMPPGRFRLVLDLVDEGRLWFAELGNRPLELELDVQPRLERGALAVRIAGDAPAAVAATHAALASQDEPLVEGDPEAIAFLAAGCLPAPDWSRRILGVHRAGFGAAAGSIEVTGPVLARRAARELAPWKPGFGAAPSWPHPLVCPSLVAELVDASPWLPPIAGLPALDPRGLSDSWLCDGRIRIAVDARALRRDGRRRA